MKQLRLIACGVCANLSQFFDVLAEHLAVKQPIAFDTNANIDRARRLHGGKVDEKLYDPSPPRPFPRS